MKIIWDLKDPIKYKGQRTMYKGQRTEDRGQCTKDKGQCNEWELSFKILQTPAGCAKSNRTKCE